MAANVEAMVREGINAVKAGNKEEARVLLIKATELDPYNEEGWLWLSGVVESPEDQRTCLENVLSINPNNDRARQGIAYLSGNTTPASAPRPITPPPPAPRTPTSVEWDMPATESSSVSATPRAIQEPSQEDYDDWVSRLNLGTAQDEDEDISTASSVPAFSTSSPFDGFDDNAPDSLDDFFSSGPFASAPVVEERSPSPPPAPRSPAYSFQQPPTFAANTTSQRTPMSPVPSQSIPYNFPPAEDAIPVDLDAPDSFFDTPEAEPSEDSELFGYIPKKIKATRLPGTRERTPVLMVIAALLLIVLNIGAATMFVMRLLTPA